MGNVTWDFFLPLYNRIVKKKKKKKKKEKDYGQHRKPTAVRGIRNTVPILFANFNTLNISWLGVRSLVREHLLCHVQVNCNTAATRPHYYKFSRLGFISKQNMRLDEPCVSNKLDTETNKTRLTPNSSSSVKVKLFLCLIKHHAMKTYWGVEPYHHALLTSVALVEAGGHLHAQTFYPGGKEPLVPIRKEAEWAPEPVWTQGWR
jgi:hypothetical protein